MTAEAARPVPRPLLTVQWRNLAFLHWPVEPAVAAALLPPGVRPDVLGGESYAGLVAFRMHRTGWLGLSGLPYLGSFAETNIRLYSVGPDGRRGVVFRSLDAARWCRCWRAGWRSGSLTSGRLCRSGGMVTW